MKLLFNFHSISLKYYIDLLILCTKCILEFKSLHSHNTRYIFILSNTQLTEKNHFVANGAFKHKDKQNKQFKINS